MGGFWARTTLNGYRWAGLAVYPLIGSYLRLRAMRGKEDLTRRNERYGYASVSRPEGPLIWFHAVSVGETNAVIPLIHEIRRRGIHVVLTTTTKTSAKIAAARLNPDVRHQYVPVDLKPAIGRFLEFWQPDIAIFAESEMWPMTVMELGQRHIPQILVNARLSDRSFSRWQRVGGLAEALFEYLTLVISQSNHDAERFRALGALPVLVSGNLKVDADLPPADAKVVEHYRSQIADRHTWAAISTFEGEELAAARAHKIVKTRLDLLTIIVPRHPERCDEVEKMLVAEGLNVARRVRNDPVTSQTDILLGDTIGEMGLYLGLTEIAFVGRSLSVGGGQNPLEPVMMGCAVLSGGHVQNFRETYQSLAKNGAARVVRDTEMLAKGVYYLLNNEDVRLAMINAGYKTMQQMSGALAATIKGLEPYINPLTMRARLSSRQSG